MRKKKKWRKHIKEMFFVAGAIILALLFLYVFIFVDFGAKLSPDSEYRTRVPQVEDEEAWYGVFTESKLLIEDTTLGVIVPNDPETFIDLNSFYNGLKLVKDPQNIVLIGGAKNSSTYPIEVCSECIVETEFGVVEILSELAEGLDDRNIARIADTSFSENVSVLNQMPFIKNYFPNANVLPVAINSNAEVEDIIKLRDFLDKNLLGDSLVIASVNFSDQLFKSAADLHDKSAIDTINNFEFDNISSLDTESPTTLYAILSFMEKWGQTKGNLIHTFNTQELTSDPLEKTKSYMFWTFSEMEKQVKRGVSILSTGKLFDEAELYLMNDWNLPEDYDPVKDQSAIKQLRDIRENDDRFLKGFDFLAFDLAETGCENFSQNEMEIAFCKFSEESEESGDEMFSVIYENAIKSDLVYLIYEYAGDELTTDRRKIAESFIANGVDVFVGRGIKEMTPMKYYKGGLVFYSLGDFLTSSKLANELTSNSRGLMIGLYISPTEYNIHLFPIEIISGYPKYIPLDERIKFFTEYSNELTLPMKSLNTDIVNGVFTIYR
ncbi:AmmeMemoRadiSam system protein B [Candidatus Peregrinibacteria bacterium]|nr:AmmeMemoRadiSam system protein B [Candidatus Peregrinibacteria bacterium]